jgi:hypothetical protein
MDFFEKYMDVLQNIEFGIVSAYREIPEATDNNVLCSLEALIDVYAAEKIKRQPRKFNLSDSERRIMESVHEMCEWRLGRIKLEGDEEEEVTLEPLTLDEMIQCLKRIQHSVKKWNKMGGRKGYLDFIVQYVK